MGGTSGGGGGRAARLAAAGLALVVAAACASRQLTPLGPVPQGVTVDLQDQTYPVGGSSVDEIRRQMAALGPGDSWYRYSWRVQWTYRPATVEQPSLTGSSATVCGTRDVALTLIFTRILPRWESPESAPPELVEQWETFMQAVRLHGEGHRDIAVAATREIVTRLRDLETTNCAFMEREARRLVDDILERHTEMNREYERTTEGGRTQGVAWPPAVRSG